MGDIADMLLDGILDEETGEFIDDELSMEGGPGYPRRMRTIKKKKKVKKLCPNCNQEWNGIECKHCSFDTGFDPNWP